MLLLETIFDQSFANLSIPSFIVELVTELRKHFQRNIVHLAQFEQQKHSHDCVPTYENFGGVL